MTLRDKITADLVGAMKAKEEARVSTLRMLKAAVMKFEVSGKEKKVASDQEVLNFVAKEAKQRKDSIEAFRKGGRNDLAEKEEIELKILQSYLPVQMGEAELKKIIVDAIRTSGAQSKSDVGKVMAKLMPQVNGKADGAMVSKMVGEMLNS